MKPNTLTLAIVFGVVALVIWSQRTSPTTIPGNGTGNGNGNGNGNSNGNGGPGDPPPPPPNGDGPPAPGDECWPLYLPIDCDGDEGIDL